MEPVTHLAAGLLTAQALRPGRRTTFGARQDWRGFVPLCAVAATIPDIDGLAGLLGPESYLLHHRGITHSIVLLPAYALLLAWTARRLGARPGLAQAALAAGMALLTHLFLDVVTTFGTQILAPFSHARVSFEGVFIVDPAFTLALLGFALAARLRPERSRALALCGLAVMVAYPLAGNAIRLDMQRRYESLLTHRGETQTRVSIAPDALSPWYWKVVLEDAQSLSVTTATPANLAGPWPTLKLMPLRRAELNRLGEQASFFGTYAWFAIHPAERPEEGPPEQAAGTGLRMRRFLDAAYVNSGPVMAALFGARPGFAECAAFLDQSGRLVAWRDWSGRTHPAPDTGGVPPSAHAR